MKDANGRVHFEWVSDEDVMAMAFDTPVPGFRNDTVNTLRLWSAEGTDAFDLDEFNAGSYPEAVEACRAFRAQGGRVVLLTNAPRPRASVAEQLRQFNVPDDCWDTIASSGDSARVAMFTGVIGMLAGLSPTSLAIALWVFAIARLIHMVLYYKIATEQNPSPRSYFYLIGMLSNLVLVVMIALHLLG